MISQKQNNIGRPEEEAAPPLDHKQTSTPVSSWRSWSLWLRVLGVVVALVGGFVQFFPSPLPLGVYFLVPLLVGVVSAGLLHSWWAMLVVPVAFSIGAVLSFLFQGMGIDLSSPEGVDIFVVFGVVPIVIGTLIGTPIVKKIEQRLQQ
jgi:hypothetical protein